VGSPHVVIVGAGIGGLTAAALLAARGCDVTLCEATGYPGGKAHAEPVDGASIDAGPTVFTKRSVFEAVFAACGTTLDAHLDLMPADVLARHDWGDGQSLDLFADPEASEAAIGTFAGADAARGYARFRAAAKRAHDTLDASFMQAPRTTPWGLSARIGMGRVGDMMAIRPFESLWRVLGSYFSDPRLRQLFGRYATYSGSSPFSAPATLMLIAHVEAEGVWIVEGGLSALSRALESLAVRGGARLRYNETVAEIVIEDGRAKGVRLASGERVAADRVIVNGDPAALANGLFGAAARRAVKPLRPAHRSLSAVTFLGNVRASGFDLSHHNVFFSPDYRAEFDAIGRGVLAAQPTVYLCAQDRKPDAPAPTGPERVQIIVNAPANGDTHNYSEQEVISCRRQMQETLRRSGLILEGPLVATTPSDFNARYPATGGALYGRASHGWAASFRRPGARTTIPGLYCAGGGTHPGAGVPMAALSGRLAADALMSDLISARRFHPVAMPGGMSTRSARTAGSA